MKIPTFLRSFLRRTYEDPTNPVCELCGENYKLERRRVCKECLPIVKRLKTEEISHWRKREKTRNRDSK